MFCDIFASYNDALFDSVRLMIRYEKSLKAWSEIIAGVDDKVLRDTLVMDYVHPVFVTACDLPNVFKDRLVRGCVKLATIAEGGYRDAARVRGSPPARYLASRCSAA